ncbi:DUF2490 domain-containing protein [Chryseobacterium arthrosphaerae]|uniref:DUF2490 domain-containing protein n=1 Tax=Chryseobacterium arthrosphaerae TaxID=651561 RepID=A0A3S0QT48_9FLAO|nr:DUF2490 domain-containing protein [Chryseobacterium arthrosphaerae]
MGYGFILSQPYVNGKKRDIEHRIFQQFITKQKFGRFNLQHRYRLEERFLKMIQNEIPLYAGSEYSDHSERMLPKTLYASVYNEIFLHFNSPVFDRTGYTEL